MSSRSNIHSLRGKSRTININTVILNFALVSVLEKPENCGQGALFKLFSEKNLAS